MVRALLYLLLLAAWVVSMVQVIPIDFTSALQPPSARYWLGTDSLGRDILGLTIKGAGTSLAIALIVRTITLLIGMFVGGLAGFCGGRVDTVVMRLVDIMMAFPDLLLAIGFSVAFGEPTLFSLIAVLALVSWPYSARIARSEVLSLKKRPFIEAAYALGGTRWHIVYWHLLRNVLPVAKLIFFLGLGSTMMAEAALSFLGLGVASTVTLGNLILQGFPYILSAPWISLGPAGALLIIMICSYQDPT